MTDEAPLNRITLDPKVMVGKPVIRGTRLTVEFILDLLAYGATVDEIVDEYEGLSPEDIQACLRFAGESLLVVDTNAEALSRRKELRNDPEKAISLEEVDRRMNERSK